MRTAEVSVVFIGAGNLATNLARAMHRAGYDIREVYSRTEESARSLAESVDAGWTTALDTVMTDAEIYIVALKDAVLAELLPQIAAGKGDALLVHTAGSIPMDIWKGHAVRYGVFYPMQTFSKQREVDFKDIPLFVEAARPEDTSWLKEVASTLSGKVYEATSEQRKSLHLAAVFTCNFTNHMYALAAELLARYQLPFDVMLPLIDETARKVHHLDPHEAQTGPAIRYDENVINAHLAMLAHDPEMQHLYEAISQSIYKRKTI